MTMMKTLFLALTLPSLLVVSQELPNPSFAVQQFDDTANFRQSFCDEYELVNKGALLLPLALNNTAIRPVLVVGEYFHLDEETGAINAEYPGLVAVLLDEFCSRAKCTWRDSYAVVDAPDKNHTWTDLLEWTTQSYDLSVDWWAASAERMALGIAFPESWYDADIIMVQKKPTDENNRPFNLWAWLTPFDAGVWGLIIATIVFSGLVYSGLEILDHRADKRNLGTDIAETTFLAAVTFTSHFEFHPRTHAARLFTLSLSFWAMLMGAAYTANLASFLVAQNQLGLILLDVQDAVKTNQPICTYASTQADVAVSQAFPRANYARKDTMEDVFKSVSNGECIVGITTLSAWDHFSRIKKVNEDCQLEWVGRTFEQVPAGFATVADSGTMCTSLLRDVINYHFLAMKTDGFMQAAWETYLQQTTDWNCIAAGLEEEETEKNGTLTLQNMGGIFAFHLMLTGAALVIALCTKVVEIRRKQAKKAKLARIAKRASKDRTPSITERVPRPAPLQKNTLAILDETTSPGELADWNDDASELSVSDQMSDTDGIQAQMAELRRESRQQKKQLTELNDNLSILIGHLSADKTA